jgi:hypothetical protein
LPDVRTHPGLQTPRQINGPEEIDMDPRWRRSVLGALLALVSLATSAGAAQAAVPQVGGLVQLPGAAHCYTASGNGGGCTAWPQLGLPVSIAIAPSGKLAYVASGDVGSGTGEILAAQRDAATGALSPIAGTAGCYSNTGSSSAGPGSCTVAAGAGSGDATEGVGGSTYELDGLQISSDGHYLYAASPKLDAIVWFAIDPTSGALSWSGCLSGAATPGCTAVSSLLSPDSLTLSPDGQTLYASSYDQSELAIFHRDPSTGALTQLPPPAGCVTSTGNLGACTADPMLSGPGPVVVSPDGGTLHVAQFGNASLLTYTVGSGGALSRPSGAAGCVQDPSLAGPCSPLGPLSGAYGLAQSPDGKQLYVGDYGLPGGIAAFSAPTGGTPSRIGCIFESPPAPPAGCASGAGLVYAADVVAAPDGAAVYAADGDGIACGSCGVVAFARDASTGALTQYQGAAGCQLSQPAAGSAEASCGDDPIAQGPYALAVSPDSNFVYAGGFNGAPGWLTAYQAVAPPGCQSTNVSVTAGQTVTLPLTCTDLDGNPVTVSVSGAPAHGTLGTIDQPTQTVQYTAVPGYSGTDTVGFGASDGTNSSPSATVQITVSAITVPPGTPLNITPSVNPVAPVLSGLRIARRSIALTGRLVHNHCQATSAVNRQDRQCRRTISVGVSYRLNVAARVVVTVDRLLPGRMAGHRCAVPSPANRAGRKCVRSVAVRGMLTFSASAGGNAFTFTGRIGRTVLGPGSYKLVANASAGGRSSVPDTATFTLMETG